MPVYVYECPSCGRFEARHGMDEPALSECPLCGRDVVKVVPVPAISFVGPGFHVNDYGPKA